MLRLLDTGSCTELSGVQRDLCEWHDGATWAATRRGTNAARGATPRRVDAIQWVPGESWSNTCTGWANDQGVTSMSRAALGRRRGADEVLAERA